MASLTIRKLDEKTYKRLRAQAARHGVSVGEGARQILTRAIAPPERMGDLFLKIFGSGQGADLELSPRESHDPMDLR